METKTNQSKKSKPNCFFNRKTKCSFCDAAYPITQSLDYKKTEPATKKKNFEANKNLHQKSLSKLFIEQEENSQNPVRQIEDNLI